MSLVWNVGSRITDKSSHSVSDASTLSSSLSSCLVCTCRSQNFIYNYTCKLRCTSSLSNKMEAAYWKCFITKIWLFRNSQLNTLSLVQTYLYVLIKKTKESPLLCFFLSLFLPDLCAAVTSQSPQCSNNKAHVYLYLSDLTYITWPTAICRFALEVFWLLTFLSLLYVFFQDFYGFFLLLHLIAFLYVGNSNTKLFIISFSFKSHHQLSFRRHINPFGGFVSKDIQHQSLPSLTSRAHC